MATQLSFYRSSSALQIKFVPPSFTKVNNAKYFDNHGFILLEGTLGKNKEMDWSKKITFAIGIGDLPQLLEAFHRFKFTKDKDISVELKHDPNAQTDKAGQIYKNLTIKKGGNEGQYNLQLTASNAEKPFYIYLNVGEMLLLGELISAMPTYMLGIDKQEERYESSN